MTKFLIVGQGIAGTLVALECLRRKISFHVIDQPSLSCASKVAAGIINPITGRKFVKTWMYESLEEVFVPMYQWAEELLGGKYLQRKNIIRAIPSIKDQNNWDARLLQDDAIPFMSSLKDAGEFEDQVNKKQGYGLVHGYQLSMKELISDFRSYLAENRLISELEFNHDELNLGTDRVQYQNLEAAHLIFCEGHKVTENPFFRDLPFTPAKGELLIVNIPDLKVKNILKDQLFIAPIDEQHYWVGASYAWEEFTDLPTPEKKKWLEEGLKKIIDGPYKIVEHLAGVRPATKFRKPLMGTHKEHHRAHLFNGLGTKGASLGPFWARNFMDYLEGKCEIDTKVNLRAI